MLTIVLAFFPAPVPLDSISVERARMWDGMLVMADFLVAKPSYTLLGATVVGAMDRGDGIERTAVLRGNRLDVDMGKRAAVVGYLVVIDHPATFVGGVLVPGWTEIRVEQ